MQGGFGAGDAFGVNAGVRVGDPFGGNDLIMPIIVGLGFLTALNILTDIFALFTTNESPAKETPDATEEPQEAGRSVCRLGSLSTRGMVYRGHRCKFCTHRLTETKTDQMFCHRILISSLKACPV